jgi:hypothetical protein
LAYLQIPLAKIDIEPKSQISAHNGPAFAAVAYVVAVAVAVALVVALAVALALAVACSSPSS